MPHATDPMFRRKLEILQSEIKSGEHSKIEIPVIDASKVAEVAVQVTVEKPKL